MVMVPYTVKFPPTVKVDAFVSAPIVDDLQAGLKDIICFKSRAYGNIDIGSIGAYATKFLVVIISPEHHISTIFITILHKIAVLLKNLYICLLSVS